MVVSGEALVDLVLSADGSIAGHPGGGPYNVARTLGRLEQAVAYLGCVSDDSFGRHLRRRLEDDGVSADAIVSTHAPTTLALAELDAGGSARYRFYAAGTSAPGLGLEAARAALPERMSAFYLGTLGLVFEPLASTLEALVGELDDGTLVALDPNCRPPAIEDEAAYRARLGRLLERTDLLKASVEDLAWLDPGADPVAAARGLLARDGAVAIVTVGPDGALVVSGGDVVEIPAVEVEVVDTIGAGDAFMGALLARWRGGGGDQLEEAARFACRVAGLTCARAGADPPLLAELGFAE